MATRSPAPMTPAAALARHLEWLEYALAAARDEEERRRDRLAGATNKNRDKRTARLAEVTAEVTELAALVEGIKSLQTQAAASVEVGVDAQAGRVGSHVEAGDAEADASRTGSRQRRSRPPRRRPRRHRPPSPPGPPRQRHRPPRRTARSRKATTRKPAARKPATQEAGDEAATRADLDDAPLRHVELTVD